MPRFHRWYSPGAMFFFTAVTYRRRPIFQDVDAVQLLGEVMRSVRTRWPFRTVAMVVLPDHLHCIWEQPRTDPDHSVRWRRIKAEFSKLWLNESGREPFPRNERLRPGEREVWQRRYWEHLIRDGHDLETHLDYVHFNPVKHGLVCRPSEWPWSTYHRFERLGHYPSNWGGTEPDPPPFQVGE